MIPLRSIALVAFSLFLQLPSAHAVIIYRTADPAQNTTPRVNDVAGNGWNYAGTFGGFLGTAIAPHYFITHNTSVIRKTSSLSAVSITTSSRIFPIRKVT
jgi:hypothetical protein